MPSSRITSQIASRITCSPCPAPYCIACRPRLSTSSCSSSRRRRGGGRRCWACRRRARRPRAGWPRRRAPGWRRPSCRAYGRRTDRRRCRAGCRGGGARAAPDVTAQFPLGRALHPPRCLIAPTDHTPARAREKDGPRWLDRGMACPLVPGSPPVPLGPLPRGRRGRWRHDQLRGGPGPTPSVAGTGDLGLEREDSTWARRLRPMTARISTSCPTRARAAPSGRRRRRPRRPRRAPRPRGPQGRVGAGGHRRWGYCGVLAVHEERSSASSPWPRRTSSGGCRPSPHAGGLRHRRAAVRPVHRGVARQGLGRHS